MEIEHRVTDHKVELRIDDEKMPTLVGYGAVFSMLSENLGGFREIIAPGAFDDVLNDDVRALFNHDSNIIMGRNGNGTLKLSVDAVGLRYEIMPPNTSLIRDMVLTPVERGDVNQSSFGFRVDMDSWDEDEDGRLIRTIQKVQRLIDVSPVTFPAYPDTSVAMRSLETHKGTKKTPGTPPAGPADLQKTIDERDAQIVTLTDGRTRDAQKIADLIRVNKAIA